MTDAAAAPPVHDPGFCAARHRPFILAAAILASALGLIDGSVVAIAMPAIRGSLDAGLVEAQWIVNAYMLTLSALILTGGAVADRFGLARVFGGGIALFVVASLACAAAPTPEVLIAARAVQGAGAALMVPGSLALISRAYPRAERGRAIGTWAAASALTTALGPVVGGVALTAGGPEMWRWIFAVNLPLGALALWLLWRHVGRDPADPRAPVDLLGAGTATLGLGLIAVALTGAEAGHAGPQGALALGAAGAAVLALFVVVEARSAHPMLPLSLFRNRAFVAANAATFALYFALSTVLFFLPMTAIGVWGVSEIAASAAFAPLSVFIFLFSARAGRWADRIGPGPVIACGAALVAVGYAALALTAPFQAFWTATLPAMAVAGLGMAAVVAPLSAAVMGAVSDDATAIASGVNNALSRTAGLVAVAAMGSVAAGVYAAAGGPESFAADTGGPAHAAATTAAFAVLAWGAAGLAGLSAVLAYAGLAAPAGGSAKR
ncbi:MFS transporter [Rhodobacteraceae bacterium CCMM004]|nr:MFS transporter [Rhodobacteraceae bacterium CCMM004]